MARPRAFDEAIVLDKAMEVFWRLGYEGAAMSDLSAAMGLNSPSIYAAFGSKRGLFDAVLERYLLRRESFGQAIAEAPTARAAAERMLFGAIDWLVSSDEPLGCLLIQAGLSTGKGNEDVPAALAEQRGHIEKVLHKRLVQGQVDGDLAASADPAKLAKFINLVFMGLAVQAAAGVSRRTLREMAKSAFAGWPASAMHALEPTKH